VVIKLDIFLIILTIPKKFKQIREEFVRINVKKEFLKRNQSLSGITFKIIEYRFCETRENPRSGTWKVP